MGLPQSPAVSLGRLNQHSCQFTYRTDPPESYPEAGAEAGTEASTNEQLSGFCEEGLTLAPRLPWGGRAAKGGMGHGAARGRAMENGKSRRVIMIQKTSSRILVYWVVLCAGMLMIILDQTIVNVALPTIQSDLGFRSRAWPGSSTPTC